MLVAEPRLPVPPFHTRTIYSLWLFMVGPSLEPVIVKTRAAFENRVWRVNDNFRSPLRRERGQDLTTARLLR